MINFATTDEKLHLEKFQMAVNDTVPDFIDKRLALWH